MGKKIVFLDRDGVINKLVERDGRQVSPRTFADFELLPDVPIALRELRDSGFQIVVATNQPDISRGLMEIRELELMNDFMYSIGINEIQICSHSNEDNCECRKPKAGLLREYLKGLNEVVSEMWMVGDNQSDIDAGRLVNANVIQIVNGKTTALSDAEKIASNLLEATRHICQR